MDGLFTDEMLAGLLPWPDKNANKYTRGKLVLVAGCAKYPGAACLAATAASRMGAGYVQVCCADESASVVRAWQPSLVVTPWSMGVSLGAQPTKEKPIAFAVGPGFDARDAQCSQIVKSVLQSAADSGVPLLVDGGALGIVADNPACFDLLRACGEQGVPAVVTPHGGEAARLAKGAGVVFDDALPADDAQKSAAEALSRAMGAVVVLKGPNTWVASAADGSVRCSEITLGTPALAKAGTGDILAGMISGLLAQGVAPFEAALLGANLHARAGAIAGNLKTDICTMPEDVLDAIPEAVRTLN